MALKSKCLRKHRQVLDIYPPTRSVASLIPNVFLFYLVDDIAAMKKKFADKLAAI